jgi:hypothetical protein
MKKKVLKSSALIQPENTGNLSINYILNIDIVILTKIQINSRHWNWRETTTGKQLHGEKT